jgi:hypothetical protein
MTNIKAEKDKYKVIQSFSTTEEQAKTLEQWKKQANISKSELIRKKLFKGESNE